MSYLIIVIGWAQCPILGMVEVREVLDISTYDSGYVSLFITHFLNTPEKVSKFYLKLYINLKLSTLDIEKITQSSWSKSFYFKSFKKAQNHKYE